MAQRRMFSKVIIDQARFLRLPATARLAFYDLGMHADDDGFSEGFTVCRSTGATEDDLRALERAGFIRILNDDLICWIVVWEAMNKITGKRYHPSIYNSVLEDLKAGRLIEASFIEGCLQNANMLLADCTQNDDNLEVEASQVQSRVTQGILEEDRGGHCQGQVSGSDLDPDEFFKRRFPELLKDVMVSWIGFKEITIDSLRKLIYEDGIAPEVIMWVACSASNNSTRSQRLYFEKALQEKIRQGCKTIQRLLQLEGTNECEKREIYSIVEKIRELRDAVEKEWESDEAPF